MTDANPKPLGRFTVDNDDGDAYVRYTVFKLPEHMVDDEIDPWVKETFPVERCYHAHDCCGHFYAGIARWSYVEDGPGSKSEIIVRQDFNANI